jgi:type II pantothenate kinase
MIGIDAGASLWKLARVGEGLETASLPTGAFPALQAQLQDWNAEEVRLTGGGAARIAAALDGMRIAHVSEFEAWGRGAPRLAERAGWSLPERYLLVSLGTGTSMLAVEGTQVRRAGGASLGGGTLLGLGKLLCHVETFADLAALAAQGERGRVDLLVRDIYPEGGIALHPDWTASSFAKLASREPADLAHALMGLLGENIGIPCAAVAHALSLETLVFGGSPLEDNPTLQEILEQTVALAGREACILPHGAFCGAVGAALS